MKVSGRFKKFIATCLIVLLSTNSFAAVINSYDGNLFVTKKEFEDLKTEFDTQVKNYNDSIDGKISGAIEEYLYGIRLTKKQKLKNLLTDQFSSFTKNKSFEDSRLGTRYKANIVLCFMNTNGYSSRGMAQVVTEATYNSYYSPATVEKNANDPERLYQAKKVSYDGKEYYTLMNLLDCNYIAMIGGGNAGEKGVPTSQNGYIKMPSVEVTRGTKQYFGANDGTFTMSKYSGGTWGETGRYIYGWIAQDEVINHATFSCLAGGTMTNNEIKILDLDDSSYLGDDFATAQSTGGFVLTYYDNTQKVSYNTPAGSYATSFKIHLYRHKYKVVKEEKIINDTLTNIVNEPIYYYNGCPLFTATENGEVSFKLKFTNSKRVSSTFALDSKKFKNEENPASAGDIEGCNITNFVVENGKTIDVSFDVKKDTTYWIKVDPDEGNTKIEVVGDIVQE